MRSVRQGQGCRYDGVCSDEETPEKRTKYNSRSPFARQIVEVDWREKDREASADKWDYCPFHARVVTELHKLVKGHRQANYAAQQEWSGIRKTRFDLT